MGYVAIVVLQILIQWSRDHQQQVPTTMSVEADGYIYTYTIEKKEPKPKPVNVLSHAIANFGGPDA